MTEVTSKDSADVGSIESSVKDDKRDAAKAAEKQAAEDVADEDEDDEEDEDFVRFHPPLLPPQSLGTIADFASTTGGG